MYIIVMQSSTKFLTTTTTAAAAAAEAAAVSNTVQASVCNHRISLFCQREQLLSITERIPLHFSESFYSGLCNVRHSPSTITNS